MAKNYIFPKDNEMSRNKSNLYYDRIAHEDDSPRVDIFQQNNYDSSSVLFRDKLNFGDFESEFMKVFLNETNTNTNKGIIEPIDEYKLLFDIQLGIKRDKHLERKYGEDNISKKIKISYLNFTLGFINNITNKILDENNEEFLLDKFSEKRKFSKKYINEFRQKTIEQALALNGFNKYICKKIKNEPKLRDVSEILQKNIFFFFDNVYYQERKNIYNLNEYGLSDFEFYLPKEIELFDDLLLKNSGEEYFNTYKSKMRECCRKYFIVKNKNINFITRKVTKRKNKKNK